jgi:hypothetical protein
VEWHLTPEYIHEHWTEELLTLMFLKRQRRIERHAEAVGDKPREISDSQLFERMGVKPAIN